VRYVILGGETRCEAHVNEQALTEAQEEILAKWIEIQGHHGVPMTYASVGQCAEAISGQHIRVVHASPIRPQLMPQLGFNFNLNSQDLNFPNRKFSRVEVKVKAF
jgi:hypothetical protein